MASISNPPIHAAAPARAPGRVRLARQPGRQTPAGQSRKWPAEAGFTTVSVCSNGGKLGRALSPFTLGPVTALEHGDPALPRALIFENFWQNLKVFTMEADAATRAPLPRYFARRDKGFASAAPRRRVYSAKQLAEMGGAKCEYALWEGRRLGWVEARATIYCPVYETLVRRTAAYRDLEARHANGENLILVGFDGFHFDSGAYADRAALEAAALAHLRDEAKVVGHEFVLACMLLGLRPWVEHARSLAADRAAQVARDAATLAEAGAAPTEREPEK